MGGAKRLGVGPVRRRRCLGRLVARSAAVVPAARHCGRGNWHREGPRRPPPGASFSHRPPTRAGGLPVTKGQPRRLYRGARAPRAASFAAPHSRPGRKPFRFGRRGIGPGRNVGACAGLFFRGPSFENALESWLSVSGVNLLRSAGHGSPSRGRFRREFLPPPRRTARTMRPNDYTTPVRLGQSRTTATRRARVGACAKQSPPARQSRRSPPPGWPRVTSGFRRHLQRRPLRRCRCFGCWSLASSRRFVASLP